MRSLSNGGEGRKSKEKQRERERVKDKKVMKTIRNAHPSSIS